MSDIPFQYQSIKDRSRGIYKDRNSKFHAYLLHVKTIDEVERYLAEMSSHHPKARHICYAYRLGIDGTPYRINDNGEPSGTAGRPIFNVLLSEGVSDVLGVVVRYFGGTKLGVPGLIKAYKEATIDAFSQADIMTVTLTKEVKISYRIEDLGRIYDILKARGVNDIKSHFDPSAHVLVKIPLNEIPTIRQAILADYYGYQIGDISEDFKSDRLEVEVLEMKNIDKRGNS